ncbi:cytochrome P460 family protein [Oceanibium sediminis]|uniref:cytochrome P460 family protein n=1 Tax=Oceanibium sediminis TaxID=2026339 RepID=UPI000DD3153C|nr:cytochrome P460 family protein [Oceanibium sediminis]
MKAPLLTAAALTTLTLGASQAAAQDCVAPSGDPFELDAAAVAEVYACMEAGMLEGYTSGDDPVAPVYRDWTVTATRPAVAGPHGERLLLTFANETAAEQYLKFETEGVAMPAGSVLAKESIKLGEDGKARVGPLFIMTKVASGEAEDTDNWVYSGVLPNGKPLSFKQSFCHDCHAGFAGQDALAYPVEEVRVGATN